MLNRLIVPVVAAATLLSVASTAKADDWSPWQNLNSSVQWSTTIVRRNFEGAGNHFYTWKFRNVDSRTITSLRFQITEYKANGRTRTFNDLMPFSLRPGQVFGGWTAFSAVGNRIAIRITEIKFPAPPPPPAPPTGNPGPAPNPGTGWSAWQNLNSTVQWSTTIVRRNFEGVGNHFYTWKFRNSGGRTIRSLRFQITEYKANGRTRTFNDLMPFSLRPGQIFGGWAAFSAVGSRIAIRLTEVGF